MLYCVLLHYHMHHQIIFYWILYYVRLYYDMSFYVLLCYFVLYDFLVILNFDLYHIIYIHYMFTLLRVHSILHIIWCDLTSYYIHIVICYGLCCIMLYPIWILISYSCINYTMSYVFMWCLLFLRSMYRIEAEVRESFAVWRALLIPEVNWQIRRSWIGCLPQMDHKSIKLIADL